VEVYEGFLPFPRVFVRNKAGVEVIDGGLEMTVIMGRIDERIPPSVFCFGLFRY
jgi:hypothetical protein